MKKDVFGLGLSQYLVTAGVLGACSKFLGGLSGPASVVVGGALSLSSSAFVLQLIKDKKELATPLWVGGRGPFAPGKCLLLDSSRPLDEKEAAPRPSGPDLVSGEWRSPTPSRPLVRSPPFELAAAPWPSP